MQAGYELAVEVPTAEDYRRLRVAAGLSPDSAAAAAAVLLADGEARRLYA